LSRGSSPAGYPAEPLVSYQINRQLSGWIPPPLVIRAFGAHCHSQTFLFNDFGQDQTSSLYQRRSTVVVAHRRRLVRSTSYAPE
jgi:hypothetical protein